MMDVTNRVLVTYEEETGVTLWTQGNYMSGFALLFLFKHSLYIA